MERTIITNNPLVYKKYSDTFKVDYYNIKYIEILEKVRDMIHKGHKLLTHPLSGSIKPNETPYKSIIISSQIVGKLDLDSLMIIEESISTTKKFNKDFKTPKWFEKVLKDFQVIDLSLINGILKNKPD